MEEKKLASLLGPGISADPMELGRFMSEVLLEARISCGRPRLSISLPKNPELMEKLEGNQKALHFSQQNLVSERIRPIPSSYEREYSRIERATRTLFEGVVAGLITRERYQHIKGEYLRLRDEYFAVADRVTAIYDTLMDDFRLALHEYLTEAYPASAVAALEAEVLRRIPSRQDYRSGVYLNLHLREFQAPPAAEDEITQDLLESWKDVVVEKVTVMIRSAIADAFTLLGSACRALETTGQVSARTLNALKKQGEELAWKNVFGNGELENLRVVLTSLDSADPLNRALAVESALGECWLYGKAHGLDLPVCDTPYSAADLDALAEEARA